jgi:hypothetical protein
MQKRRIGFGIGLLVFGFSLQSWAVTPELKAKLDAKVKELQAVAADSAVVEAVKDYTKSPPAEYQDMTNEKWKGLTLVSPEVKALAKNKLAVYLKGKLDASVTEVFVSAANGNKVAFLSKPTSWCHKGKPKHDVPMTGKVWIGEVEVDESTGAQQVQVALPVVDGGKPIGSIVVGLSVSKL